MVEHDAILAATSHLPHVLAYSLVDALAQSDLSEDIFRFAAGGFRDFTRIASSDPIMWRDIALANREELLKAMDNFSAHLGGLRQAIADGDAAAMEQIFVDAKAVDGTLLWGYTATTATNGFADPTCVDAVKAKARKCTLGAEAQDKSPNGVV